MILCLFKSYLGVFRSDFGLCVVGVRVFAGGFGLNLGMGYVIEKLIGD